MKRLLFVIPLLTTWALLAASNATAKENPLEIARMKVTIMPEYDSAATLVIEEGKFADKERFPAKVTFNLPEEITRLTDVCSLSPGGHHFCQLYEIRNGPGKSYIEIRLPYADFFVDYQYAPFTVRPASHRTFVYRLDPVYTIRRLEVHVQQPARSTDFSVDPAGGRSYEKEGLTYLVHEYENVGARTVIPFSIRYYKEDTAPSVEEAFSAMNSPNLFEGNTGEWLLSVGIALAAAAWFVRRLLRGRKT